MRSVKSSPLGLYLHIPFCKSKCIYCDFYSLPHAEEQMDPYVEVLTQHLREAAPRCQHNIVDTVYFGGGTPSYLGEKRLLQLLEVIRRQFPVDKKAEITLEANPDSIGDWRALRRLRRAGVNRISLGVQSAHDEELAAIGRIHTFAQVQEAVAAVRKAGIKNLSLDLIYGLPHQTPALWQSTLEQAVALSPEHISCYGLKIEEGTPLWQMREQLVFPDEDTQAELYLQTVAFLEQNGYRQYEISNFAREGFPSRHNSKYWRLEPYAGFGPGAHSDFGDVRYAYVRDVTAYCRGVTQGEPLLSEREEIPPRERAMEYLILGLRTVRGIERSEFEGRFRLPFAPVAGKLAQFVAAGYAVEEQGRWHLTPQGFLVSNAIIGEVLEALAQEKLRREQAAARGDYRVR